MGMSNVPETMDQAVSESPEGQDRRLWNDEKVRWAVEHGSEYLRGILWAGYDGKAAYVRERAAKEYPGWIIDDSKKAAAKVVGSPSPEAFALAQEVGGVVLWVTRLDRANVGSGRQAVVISSYLGEYELFKLF